MDFPETIPSPQRDVVLIGWDQSCAVEEYVDRYLQDRSYPLTGIWRDAVRNAIAVYEQSGPLRKSDVDYYLDANRSAWAPEPIEAKKSGRTYSASRLFGILEFRRPGS
jgi:hypothetical protein